MRYAGIVLFVSVSGLLLLPALSAQRPSQDPRLFVKRPPLTTSRVIGSPDPPPPYRKEKAFPALKANFPIHVVHQPGSDRLLFVGETGAYAPSAVYRMRDDPKVTAAEKLFDLP